MFEIFNVKSWVYIDGCLMVSVAVIKHSDTPEGKGLSGSHVTGTVHH